MKKHTFHNTTHETGETLQSYEAKAYTQEQQVADFFVCHPGEIFSPWEIQNLVFKYPKPPITSVRRAMSNLTRDGILTKTTEKKVVGIYGHSSYAWVINQKYYESLMAMEIVFGPEDPEVTRRDMDPLEGKRMDSADLQEADKGSNLDDQPQEEVIPHEAKRSRDETKKDLQGQLFDVAPIKTEERCVICNRKLTDPGSIAEGIGPVCSKRCKENAEMFVPKGKKIRS